MIVAPESPLPGDPSADPSEQSGALPAFVVEDDPSFARALLRGLESSGRVRVVGWAPSAEQALAELPSTDAQVALLDIELPGLDGIGLVRALRRSAPGCVLVMLTTFVDEDRVFEALRAGASGYLVKGTPVSRIVQALHDVDAGGTVIEPRLARRLWLWLHGCQAPRAPVCPLEPDDVQLLELMARGLTNAEAGGVLGIGRRTVRTRLYRLYGLLGAHSHVEAVTEAVRRGWIQV